MVQKCPSPRRVFFHWEMSTSRWLTLSRSPTCRATPISTSMLPMIPTGRPRAFLMSKWMWGAGSRPPGGQGQRIGMANVVMKDPGGASTLR